MRCSYFVRAMSSIQDWERLPREFVDGSGGLLASLLGTLREAGCSACVEEGAYIDRDFSAAYAAFYATLYKPYTKYCRRLHFFASSPPDLALIDNDAEALATWLEERAGDYLGYIVVRPLRHAPVSHAVLSARDVNGVDTEVSVRCSFMVHLLGVELQVTGFPITEQDTRTGACAQAAMWTASRFLHHRHSAPWFSMPQITEAAMRPADSELVRSLPAGSDYLTADNMVRALRAMGKMPKIYVRDPDTSLWDAPPASIIARYLDSGIPVIIGLSRPKQLGHAVVAIGVTRMETWPSAGLTPPSCASAADRITHFVVNDDQRGAYGSLPVKEADSKADSIPFDLDQHAEFILVPLPDKVFVTAEIAEELAWEKVRLISRNRRELVANSVGKAKAASWAFDDAFHDRVNDGLVARTYLTSGWKYKQRTLGNHVPRQLKKELRLIQLPRFVWVTEFSLPQDNAGYDPCDQRVRAHVVVDATGSRFWESVILTHVPGVVLISTFDVGAPGQASEQVLRAVAHDGPYFPKVRGWKDYSACAVRDGDPGGVTTRGKAGEGAPPAPRGV